MLTHGHLVLCGRGGREFFRPSCGLGQLSFRLVHGAFPGRAPRFPVVGLVRPGVVLLLCSRVGAFPCPRLSPARVCLSPGFALFPCVPALGRGFRRSAALLRPFLGVFPSRLPRPCACVCPSRGLVALRWGPGRFPALRGVVGVEAGLWEVEEGCSGVTRRLPDGLSGVRGQSRVDSRSACHFTVYFSCPS